MGVQEGIPSRLETGLINQATTKILLLLIVRIILSGWTLLANRDILTGTFSKPPLR
jgi:hypothetical protein